MLKALDPPGSSAMEIHHADPPHHKHPPPRAPAPQLCSEFNPPSPFFNMCKCLAQGTSCCCKSDPLCNLLMQEIMGVLIGSAVIPIALCLMWKKTNKWGAIAGAVLGQWFGLIAWVIFAKVRIAFDLWGGRLGFRMQYSSQARVGFSIAWVIFATHVCCTARHLMWCLHACFDS